MELRDYIRILHKSWVMILIFVLVAVAAAATYSLMQTPKFSASAKVFVSTQSTGTAQDLAQGNSFSVQRVKTYSDLVAAPIVLLPVIGNLGLGITADDLAKQVTASAPLDTSIIEIAVSDTDPVRAADIANAISISLAAVVQTIETPESTATGVAGVSPVKLTRAQEATVPSAPVSPNVPLNIALGLLVGLALGVGAAVLRETLDTRIRNERDVEQVTDIPILGGIVFDSKAQDRPLIVHVDPRSPRAESFRTLRTNLQFLDVGRTDRSFVITSSIESEGKSTTGANLAIALADSGARVLLVDADLRRPKIADYMGIDGTVGLTDLLVGRADLADIIQPWGRSKLFVLPAGQVPPNPSELLGSARMTYFVGEFNKNFDVVIFDAPPLLPVTDAAILAKSVGGALVVVAAGRVHKNQLTGAIAALGNVGASVSGLVLTMLPTSGADASGYGRYGYGYGYGADDADTVDITPRNGVRKVKVRN
ncbi:MULTISPECIES: polysaccharide biosynthesis tyrosine autokinase [unclassified Cryobacterium]|uniref:polysaccharide biosynthesis tyrosine autokinase n=1 Tax=unclassified Cryobacterium TaxID=2649013 RepID=UPI002AB45B35|nr:MULTISPECIES: polysaccharide biosynthesis tyrosine autokinase [unclassified Cryobacterium]MDY7526484.1 polysaccharide biosynthesis tyrosine autokinase [Cryobacterium sp. 10C2]MEB0004388.1 polysaccharide biosynthesis tyrosine autokinase [Cryobacterium sp. RTC2.1]MEB0201624.1 polysaccharide biosynthesis tyrosine autokinase [Cryobacterium sp. 5I3]MEB0288744.1 polysaccharide biosynthesis tyrosine autokinase [Cryobacterium sp. 10S3]MEB0289842.1 polysaccharide biosynthesis tyrosine autokinase [Cr